MKWPSLKAAYIGALVISIGGATHACYREHIVSYPVNERIDIVLSNGHKMYKSYVNIRSMFATGWPDSTGSLKADAWPVQFMLRDGRVLYATTEDLLMAPDHFVERHRSMKSGVNRRNTAIKELMNKPKPLCVEWGKHNKDFLYCPVFFIFKHKGDFESIELVDRDNISSILGRGWYFDSVSITLNEQAMHMPAISEFPMLADNNGWTAGSINSQVRQKRYAYSVRRDK